jgi:formate hydrogenlyase subunit 3/multisubunit Na+/H+ antiporter MnhD subunit
MFLILVAMVCFCSCGVLSLPAGNNARRAAVTGAFGAVAGCLAGLIPAACILWTGHGEEFRAAWPVPFGSFFIGIDSLSAFFLIPIFLLSALAAIFGAQYMPGYGARKNFGAFWFFFNILIAGMVMVVVARNAVLFLVSWEAMSLSSFFLVTFENEKESVRRAGWTYLVATHLGVVFLLVLFLVLSRQTGAASLDFDAFVAARSLMAPIAGAAFVLALIGFGAKAGFIPFHVWLPEAHPAAPSHVSAVMSGVMIKTGIYGLLRTLTFLGTPAPWWGWVLIGVGVTSGILGVLFALAQHDLKRLLAYHSVENIGIIALGLGLGLLGMALNHPVLAVLGFGGALLHVVNHALFKGLLFLGAGSVLHATGTLEIDRLGGLIKRMPWTATTFLVGAVAISGLPPLNGFVSEFIIYIGAFTVVAEPAFGIAGATVIVGLALIGGLAAACFTKAFGVIFLGEPRSALPAEPHEAAWGMRAPMVALASACALVALLSGWALRLTAHAVSAVTGYSNAEVQERMAVATGALAPVVLISLLLVFLVVLLVWARRRLLAHRSVTQSRTWGCGYTRPTARMQYTASSYAQPLLDMFKPLLRPSIALDKPEGLFPVRAALETETPDFFRQNLYRPVFGGVAWLVMRLRWLQEGHVQLYIFYIVLTLLILLIWNLR